MDIDTIIDMMQREDEDGLFVWFGEGWMGAVAEVLRDAAYDQGWDAGYTEGRKSGLLEGFDDGYAAGLADRKRERI